MNRKKLSGSAGLKIIWVLISYVGVLCLAIGISAYWTVYERTGYGAFTDIFTSEEKEYFDSDYFNSLYLDSVNSLADYIGFQKAFETDHAYDGGKLINIESYMNERKAQPEGTEEAEQPSYYLKDLLEWADEGLVYEEPDEAVDGETTTEGTATEEIGMESAAVNDEDAATSITIYENGENSYNLEIEDAEPRIREQFVPANADSLFDFAATEEESIRLQDTLLNVLNIISEDFIYYKELESKFADTNFRYFVYDDNAEEFYTNTEYLTETEAETDLKRFGRFVEMDSEAKGYETNMQLSYRAFHDNFTGYNGLFTGDYSVITAVDTEFPVSDVFTQQEMPYEELIPWLRILFSMMLFGVIAVLASLIALTASAGVVSNSEEIRLNWFDRIKTELAALLMIALGLITISVAAGGTPFYSGSSAFVQTIIYLVVYVSVIMCLEQTWFLIGYTSLVRRIKAHTMWSNSLCNWIMQGVSLVLTNSKVTGRLMLYYAGFVFLNMILMYLSNGYSTGGRICFILVWIIDILTGIKILEAAVGRQKIKEGIGKISGGNLEYKIPVEHLNSGNRDMAEAVNHIGEGLHNAVEESLKSERLKTDLITNVSHDIKTPLTSIINYVDLLKRENIENEKVKGYIEILDNKSQRLKHLTEDLVEVSRVSSGNINLSMARLNFVELVHQTIGEFNEKFQAKNLELITNLPKESVVIIADGRRLWRIIENLYNNIAKYAMENTRVYADLTSADGKAQFSIKNISAQALNFSGEELTERFIRGDVSRSTEGSGLGLSIAKSLTESQGGEFKIYLDGDLFKVTIRFEIAEASAEEKKQEPEEEQQ
ncbi:MAG: HAMP domain-containing sensor histidine kinase [Lachnospiraceae bacterium]